MKDSKIKKRLKEFLKFLKIGQGAFESNVEISNGYVNNIGESIGSKITNKIKLKYPLLNINWLLTGEGEMLNKKENISIASEPSLEYKKEPSKLDRFDSLSFEEKLKEIYAGILSSKNEAKENKKTIRKNKRISEEKIFDLQEQLFEIQEKVTVLKNKKQLG